MWYNMVNAERRTNRNLERTTMEDTIVKKLLKQR